jgi:hypothetical protein
MKVITLLALLPLLAPLRAAEESRTWTDATGRKIAGTLKSKDDRSADILLANGKRAKIPLKQLSDEDRDYVAAADVHPDVVMLATTRKVDSNEAKSKWDARSIDVTLSKVHGRDYTVEVLWLGDGGDKNAYGIHKRQMTETQADGPLRFEVVYNGGRFGSNHRGWVAYIKDADGIIVAKQASQKPFERFIEGADKIPASK